MTDVDLLTLGGFQYSTVQYLSLLRNELDMDPVYQRQGAIWSTEKQQLLIDSIVNGFDVPKIYVHQFKQPRREAGRTSRWALVDGKQRLEAIFGFIDNQFPLASDFVYLADGSNDAAGKTYNELATSHPWLLARLNATNLPIVSIQTDDIELIEEMFSRLNEAVPLNAAEKRNALGGPLPPAVRELSGDPFFGKKLPFGNRRYRHFDLVAKFLYWTDAKLHPSDSKAPLHGGPVFLRDVKKIRLDHFFKEMKDEQDGLKRVTADVVGVKETLATLTKTFIESDPLLSSVGMVSLYYLLSEFRRSDGRSMPPRSSLKDFEEARRVRRVANDEELRPGEYELLEFSRLAQSPNDAGALAYRLRVLDTWLEAHDAGKDPLPVLASAFPASEE